jgi:hypothetical protein
MLKPSSKTKRKFAEISETKEEEKLLKKDKTAYLKGVKKLKTEKGN